MCIAETWSEAGYDVDVVDFENSSFKPRKKYTYCIDIQNNFEKWNDALGGECIKIFHIPTAHWKFNNEAEEKRLQDIKKRRGFTLAPKRILPASKNIELANRATILGNEFTKSTYAFAAKPLHKLHISATHTYPSPEHKNVTAVRKNFIWLGGAGMAHKGLDLVLEAFTEMPEYSLKVLGKKDSDFAEAYQKELFETPNIEYVGNVDLGSEKFKDITDNSIGLVFPSCSEGSSGGVVASMHAGLIPIISYESGVDVSDFGIILKENSITEIKKQVYTISNLQEEVLKEKSLAAWKHAHAYHTRENFAREYKQFIDTLINSKKD
jgi:hypothetical protein